MMHTLATLEELGIAGGGAVGQVHHAAGRYPAHDTGEGREVAPRGVAHELVMEQRGVPVNVFPRSRVDALGALHMRGQLGEEDLGVHCDIVAQALVGVVVSLTCIHMPMLRGMPLPQQTLDALAHHSASEGDEQVGCKGAGLGPAFHLLSGSGNGGQDPVDVRDEGRVVQVGGALGEDHALRQPGQRGQLPVELLAPYPLSGQDHDASAGGQLLDEPACLFRQDERLGEHLVDAARGRFGWAGPPVQGLLEGDVQVHWTRNGHQRGIDRLVDEPACMPARQVIIAAPRQVQRIAHVQREHVPLADRLSLALVHPLLRAVRSDHKQWDALVIGLRDGRAIVEHGTSTGADEHHRCLQLLRHAQCDEAGTALIDDLHAGDVGPCPKSDHQRGTAGPWADHSVSDAFLCAKPRQLGCREVVAGVHMGGEVIRRFQVHRSAWSR